jgi:MoxR-like ATPase
MANEIKIFWGADSDFEDAISGLSKYHFLYDVLGRLNRQEFVIRNLPIEKDEPLVVENLIIHTDDYGGLNEWALLAFSNNVLKSPKLRIDRVWLANPPTKIYEDIKRYNRSDQIDEHYPVFQEISVDMLKHIATGYNDAIIGQSHVIVQVLSAMYALKNPARLKPITLLFLGDSGVGKTESAKYISQCMGCEMVRVQFSMQQTNNAYQFIFGADHNKNSLARELIRRRSNIILLDEFDKVSPIFYNAFYQMFDEGYFVDSNYAVDVSKCIIICTTNFRSDDEARQCLGNAIYSRFSKIIKFNPISIDAKIRIAEKAFAEVILQLEPEDRKLVPNNRILPFFEKYIRKGMYSNIRILKNDIEDAVYHELLIAHEIICKDN